MKKKILLGLLAVIMCFTLVGCGDKENTGGNSGSSESDNWMEVYGMENLKVPDGATIDDGFSYSATDKQIKRDTEFTDDEIETFAQSVLDNCDGAYTSKYNADTDDYEKVIIKDQSEVKGDDEYGWKYDKDGKTYSIRIYFGTRDSMRFERY